MSSGKTEEKKMQLDLMEDKTDDMEDRWVGSFYIHGKPDPAASIPFPWFYREDEESTRITVMVEAKSEEAAISLIELYLGIDIDDVEWQNDLQEDSECISDYYRWYCNRMSYDKRHMAHFGIVPPPKEEEKKVKKKKTKKKARRRGY